MLLKSKLKLLVISIVLLISSAIGYIALSLTVFSELDYVILNATNKKGGILRDAFVQYLRITDRIYTEQAVNVTWLEFVLNGYNMEFADNDRIFMVADIFLSRDVDINKLGSAGLSALHAAAIGNEPTVINYLLNNGANINIKAKYGDANFTPLEIATKMQSSSKNKAEWDETIQLLKKAQSNKLLQPTQKPRG